MPDRAPLKQLDFYKRNLRPLKSFLRAQAQYEAGKYAHIYADSWRVIAEAIQYDPRSLEKAAKYFDLDHASALERSVLAAILADIVFATRSAGRRKGATTWDADRLVLLGRKYREFETKNPTLSKEKIVEQRWSHFLRQPAKVDSPMQRTIHHEDAETVFG